MGTLAKRSPRRQYSSVKDRFAVINIVNGIVEVVV